MLVPLADILPGGRSITVNRPVRRVRLPDVGAGECASDGSIESTPGDTDKSSVQPTVCRFDRPRPCMYLLGEADSNLVAGSGSASAWRDTRQQRASVAGCSTTIRPLPAEAIFALSLRRSFAFVTFEFHRSIRRPFPAAAPCSRRGAPAASHRRRCAANRWRSHTFAPWQVRCGPTPGRIFANWRRRPTHDVRTSLCAGSGMIPRCGKGKACAMRECAVGGDGDIGRVGE